MTLITPSDIGKRIRMRRLFDSSGLMLAVPMDHGYTLGPIKGLDIIDSTVKSVIDGGASCVIVQKGMIRSIYDQVPGDRGILMHLSGSTNLSSEKNLKLVTGNSLSASKLGADGVSCHVNLGSTYDVQMLSDMSLMVDEADQLGLPTLAMIYVRGDDGIDSIDTNSLSHGARVAEESGIDIVKINSTKNAENFDEVTQGINIPIIVAGGDISKNFNDFLDTIKKCILDGAMGISIGRNIFQSDDPKLAMNKTIEAIKSILPEVDHIGDFFKN